MVVQTKLFGLRTKHLDTFVYTAPGLVNSANALDYQSCLDLPAVFTQPGDHLPAEPCRIHLLFDLRFDRHGHGHNAATLTET